MLRLLLWILFVKLCLPVYALWPAPRHFTQGNQLIVLSSNFTINFGNLKSSHPSDDLISAIQDTIRHIRTDRHQLLRPDRGRSLYEELSSQTIASNYLSQLTIQVKPKSFKSLSLEFFKDPRNLIIPFSWSHQATLPDDFLPLLSISAEMRMPLKSRDESYMLTITGHSGLKGPVAILSASSALGVLRGLQTFSQLVYTLGSSSNKPGGLAQVSTRPASSLSSGQVNSADSSGSNAYIQQNDIQFIQGPVTIQDAPAFAYRGLLLDTSRNFYPIPDLQRTIDAMSWAKLSVLHWHIVDAQSWPLEIPSHIQLSQHGAYSPAEVYTAQDVQRLMSYANSKGVEIMLEIDTPGHTAIIGESFPDLVACKDATPWTTYAAEPPAGQLRIASDAALNLVIDIFRYVTREFPGTMFSSGGDEINKKCYEHDEQTQQTLRQKNITLNQAINNFVRKSHQVIRESQKTPVVWEEIVLDQHIDLPRDTAIAVWRNSSNVRQVADAGYQIIHAASDFSYLDCGLGGWLGGAPNGTSWCDPFKTWQKIYSFDPFSNITFSQRKLILGGQALLWSEQADEQNLDTIMWPRALSTAEVYWTGSDGPRSVVEALPRMHDMRYRLVQRGVRATPLQPHWCAVNPGKCNVESPHEH